MGTGNAARVSMFTHHAGGNGNGLEAPLEENEKFRAVFEASLDPISISALDDGVYLDVNREFEQLAGLPRQEILGRTPADLGFWTDLASHRAFLAEIEQHGAILNHPAEFQGRDRSVAPTLVSAFVLGMNGQRCLVSFLRDATERRDSERRAAGTLREARENAEAAREASDSKLAYASHEIRAPLSVILGFTELLGETTLSPEQRSYLDALQRNGRELMTLLDNVLDLSKAEHAGIELDAIEFDLGAIVEDTVRATLLRVGKKDLEITGRLMPGVPNQVIGDPERFRLILTNLMQNAVKFTEKGRVALVIDTDQATDKSGALCCTVSDTGIGILPERLAAIFQPFAQGDPSIGRRFGGNGIGLAITKQLVERMGGSIEVQSSDLGTHIGFTITFALPAAVVAPSPSLAGVEVLLIDSHALERTAVAATLHARGASVSEIADGAAALAELRRESQVPTQRVILLDGRLPGLSGFQIVEALRGHRALLGRIVLLLPVQHRRDDLAELRGLSVGACLLKPIKSLELFNAIVALRALLRRR